MISKKIFLTESEFRICHRPTSISQVSKIFHFFRLKHFRLKCVDVSAADINKADKSLRDLRVHWNLGKN